MSNPSPESENAEATPRESLELNKETLRDLDLEGNDVKGGAGQLPTIQKPAISYSGDPFRCGGVVADKSV